jgi:hypothetical protein
MVTSGTALTYGIAIASVLFIKSAIRQMLRPGWINAACELNEFTDGHNRAVFPNKYNPSCWIFALVDRELRLSQPDANCIDVDFRSKKPFAVFQVVDGMFRRERKYAPNSRNSHPGTREKNRSHAIL